MPIHRIALVATLVSGVAFAGMPVPKTAPTAEQVAKEVAAVYESLRRRNAKLGDDKAVADELVRTQAAATASRKKLSELLDAIEKDEAQVARLEEEAKTRPKRKDGEKDEEWDARLDAWSANVKKLEPLKKALELAKTKSLSDAQNHLNEANKLLEAAKEKDQTAKGIGKELEGVEAELKDLKLQNTVASLKIDTLDAEQKIDVLVARLDKAMLGAYLQDKLERLLGSSEFCEAAKKCGESGFKPKGLDSMFDGKRTHGK